MVVSPDLSHSVFVPAIIRDCNTSLSYPGEIPAPMAVTVGYPVRCSVICIEPLHCPFSGTVTGGIAMVSTDTDRVTHPPLYTPVAPGGVQAWRCKGKCNVCAKYFYC